MKSKTFNNLRTRTVSQITMWVDQRVGDFSPRASWRRKLADHVLALLEGDVQASSADRLRACQQTAELLLHMSATVDMEPLSDVSRASKLLARYAKSESMSDVLRDADMALLLDRAPGGFAFMSTLGIPEIRRQLGDGVLMTDLGGPDPARWAKRLLGHDSIQPFLAEGFHKEIAVRANRVLVDVDVYAHRVIPGALMVSSEYQAKQLEVWNQFKKSGGPLLLPHGSSLTSALRSHLEWLSRDESGIDDLELAWLNDLIETIDGPYFSMRSYPHRPDQNKLVPTVLSTLASTLGLPFKSESPAENYRRLCEILGEPPHTGQLKPWSTLASLVEGACPPPPPRLNLMDDVRPAKSKGVAVHAVARHSMVATPVDVHEFLWAWVEREGRPPNKALLEELHPGLREAIESVMDDSYSLILDRLHAFDSMPLPKSSLNEDIGEVLCRTAFPDAVSWTHQYPVSSQNTSGRVDLALFFEAPLLPSVLWMEFDGEGHFEQVRDWDYKDQQRRDAARCAQLTSATQDVMLVAIHHGLLKSHPELLPPDRLRALVEAAQQSGALWSYIRPTGCSDMRKSTGCPTKHEASSDGVELFTLNSV